MQEERRHKSLQADRIYETISRLGKRIKERFPESSLSTLCEELRIVSEDAKARSEEISRPIVALRISLGVLIVAIVVGVVGAIVSLERTTEELSLAVFVQLLEAGINDVVLIGAAIFFLVTFETRIKRNRALQAIHELRSFAHIIDMHQLTKDLTRMSTTASSPVRAMTASQLERYLDYCTEMLSLVGKVAALYIQHFNDPGAVAAVNEVENLTTGLSRKIWQKITLIENHAQRLQSIAGADTPASSPRTEKFAAASNVKNARPTVFEGESRVEDDPNNSEAADPSSGVAQLVGSAELTASEEPESEVVGEPRSEGKCAQEPGEA